MKRSLLNDSILRSAMASKITYAKTIQRIVTLPICKQYLGHMCTENDTIVLSAKATGAHAYVWKTGDNSMTVAFKGSSTPKDILNLMDVRYHEFSFSNSKMYIHNGVLKMFKSIENELSSHILGNPISTHNKYITFCGHSLGGSLAMLAAAYYGNLSVNNIGISCHTFGAPKIGDSRFIEWFKNGVNDSIFINTSNDIVPFLPFGLYENLDDVSLTLDSFGRVHNDILCLDQPNPIISHDLDTYISSLVLYSNTLKTPDDVLKNIKISE
jgi:predicted lipase